VYEELIEELKRDKAFATNGSISRHFLKKISNDEIYIKKIMDATFFLQFDANLKVRLNYIKKGLTKQIVCKTCNEPVTNLKSKFCSKKCMYLSKEINDKKKRTNLERYGVEYPSQSRNVKDKVKRTNIERYGVEYYIHSNVFKENYKESCRKKYGVDHHLSSNEIKRKREETTIERYGVKHISQVPSTIKNKKRTNLKRYGVEYPSQVKTIKDKVKKTTLERYGVENISQRHLSKENISVLTSKDALYERYIVKDVSPKEIAKELNVTLSWVYSKLKHHNINLKPLTRSYGERDVFNFISSIYSGEIVQNARDIISPLELDIFIPSLNIAIEFNGIYWHSELAGTPKDYHLNKTLRCEEKGVRLIHIFETEWEQRREIVKSRIRSLLGKNMSIGARKCEIKEVSSREKREFFESTHVQGDCPSSINLGLYLKDNLVACMSFGRSRFNKEYEYELLRFSNGLNTTVNGGASRLFQHFMRNWNPKSVISYSDRRWNTGKLYKKLGFDLKGSSKPNFWVFNDFILEHRLRYQKHKLAKILEEFDPEITAWENMVNHGYNRIWDCGNLVFEWKNKLIRVFY
jgi:hypothetical protein